MAMTKVKNLQLWCKKMTDGYRDVEVRDMTSSWKNGLAFCALIHRFRPDLIDYDSLSKENILENNQLAFNVAERELNIPAFLDAPDMVAIKVPDRLSVVTYVSQYYNNLHDKPQLGGPEVKKAVASKRHQDEELEGPEAKRLTPSQTNTKTPKKERQVSMGDKCFICGDKVYLMERHVDKNKLYHRHCFRHSDLSPTSKVFNKTEIKKVNDRVKKENEARKENAEINSQSKPDFWKRRNEARKIEKMDTGDSLLSNGKVYSENEKNISKPNESILDKSEKTGKNISKESMTVGQNKSEKTDKSISKEPVTVSQNKSAKNDKTFSKEPEPTKIERPSELNLRTKKVTDMKPTSRKNEKENVELMDTSEVSNVKLKPIPTPRNFTGEKEPSFLLNIKDKRTLSPSSIPGQKLSSSSDKSPFSPPPLPSQPPPTQLVKSDLISPRTESPSGTTQTSTFNITLSDKSKRTTVEDRKSPQFNIIESPASVSSNSPDSVFLSPRNKFCPVSFDSKSSSDSSKTKSETKQNKVSPKATNKFTSSSTGSKSTERSSKFSPPLSKPGPFDKRQMSVEEAEDLTSNPTNSNETIAVVFTPSKMQQEENDKQVLGGLLSNLANIRKKKLSETSPSEELSNQRNVASVLDNQTKDKKGHMKSAIVTKPLNDSDQNKLKHTKDHESHLRDKKDRSDSDIPEWKRQLEKNKNSRPKSVDVLSNKQDDKKKDESKADASVRPTTELAKVPHRPKSVDLFSDKHKVEQKPQWQIEAEKRMEARKGAYVDPEKAKSNIDTNKDLLRKKDILTRPSDRISTPIKPTHVDITITDDDRKSTRTPVKTAHVDITIKDNKQENTNVQKRVLPTVPTHREKPDHKESPTDKKKISVNEKFDFSKDADKSGKIKPPRPPPFSPGSPKSITPERPTRPPPPLKDGDVKRLSPTEIQKQLTEIDSRLTDLEIRGRQLEDSIRKAQEEEDDKMMVEWFDLVNNKNELVRKEADLIYLSRAQELEEEQHDIDRRLRDIIQKEDKNKTSEEKEEEEYLLQKLLQVINQRNIIVDSIDEDRIRYEEEDKDIAMALQALSHESGEVTIKSSEASYKKKKKKKKKGKLL